MFNMLEKAEDLGIKIAVRQNGLYYLKIGITAYIINLRKLLVLHLK